MEPRDAATVMLVRDAPGADAGVGNEKPGVEVFMLRRNLSSVFVAGAFVFPGGAVDAGDRTDAMAALVDGINDPTASARLDRERGGLGFWVAAIRESFEEAGVLLARDASTRHPATPEHVARLLPVRAAVAGGDRAFVDVVSEAGLILDGGALRVFGHWITPSPAPRRYDTWFFLAPAPEGHGYIHDDSETIASTWVRPTDALEAARRNELELIYPTYRSLEAVSRFQSAAELFEAVDAAWRSPERALAPVVEARAWQVRLPGDGDDDERRIADAIAHSTTAHGRASDRRVAGAS